MVNSNDIYLLKHFLDSLIIREFGAAHCEVHLAGPPRQGAVTEFKDVCWAPRRNNGETRQRGDWVSNPYLSLMQGNQERVTGRLVFG
jgi:hypothetical protein